MTDVLSKQALMSEFSKSYLLTDIAKAGENYVAVGAKGHILRSTNKGRDWQQVKVPTSVLLTAVHFPSANQGWAVGHGGIILHSSDGGKTWKKQFDGLDAVKSMVFEAERHIKNVEKSLRFSSSSERENIEFELEEAQFNLEDTLNSAKIGPTNPFLDVLFLNNKEGFAIGAYGYFFKTLDGGNTWLNYSYRLANLDDFHLNAIAHIDRGTLLITGEGGTIFRSSDKGESWETIDSPTQGSLTGLVSDNNNIVLAFGIKGILIRSINAGLTWAKVNSGTTNNLFGASFSRSGDISIVGSSGTVLYSQDNGKYFSVKNRDGERSYTSSLLIKNNQILVTGESGISIITSSGDSVAGFPEQTSLFDKDYYATISNYATSDKVMTLVIKTPEWQCANYEVMDMVDRMQWRLESTKGVSSTASLVTISKHVVMDLNEGSLKWFELSRNDNLINASLRREPGLVNESCSLSPILVFLENDHASTISKVSEVMIELARDFSRANYKVIASKKSTGFEALNQIESRESSESISKAFQIELGVTSGDIFTKSYIAALSKTMNKLSHLKNVVQAHLTSVLSDHVNWAAITENGFEGGPILPGKYNGSSSSITQFRQNVLKSGQVGGLVADDFKSSTIFIPFSGHHNTDSALRDIASELHNIPNLVVKIYGYD
jgi:photosystem II stability/assembly factor-like uncharacterized protein